MVFSNEFAVGAIVRNSYFGDVSKLGHCCSSVGLTISFISSKSFKNTKIYRKSIFKVSGFSLEMAGISKNDHYLIKIKTLFK